MTIQNAPLTKEQIERINHFIVELGNKMACSITTGIDTRTINSILKREWASVDHIKMLMDYCDKVEGFTVENNAD